MEQGIARKYERMDYRLIRKRIWRRRIVVSVLAALLGIGISYYSINLVEVNRQNTAKKNAFVQSPSTEVDDWNQVLEDLDNLRAQAIMRKDESVLNEIYSNNCQLKLADTKLIRYLISKDLSILGLDFEITSVEIVSHRWSNNEEVVELQVTDNRSNYSIRSRSNEQTIAEQTIAEQTIVERGEETWLISLLKVGQKWLISNAQPVLDDR
jgi:hypothetical protein